jgi:hypothetical protein
LAAWSWGIYFICQRRAMGREIESHQGSMLWWQFSAIFPNFWQKIGVFLKYQCFDHFYQNLALFWVKNANFLRNFSAKIFKNHNIGPRVYDVICDREKYDYMHMGFLRTYHIYINPLLNRRLRWCRAIHFWNIYPPPEQKIPGSNPRQVFICYSAVDKTLPFESKIGECLKYVLKSTCFCR